MKLRLNIKFRLTLWYLFFLAVVLVFFSTVTYILLSESLYDIARSPSAVDVAYRANIPGGSAGTRPAEQPVLLVNYTISGEWLARLQAEPSSNLTVHTPAGQVIIDQHDFITPGMSGEQQVQLYYHEFGDGNAASFFEILAVVQPVSGVKDTLAAFRKVLVYVIPVTALLAAGLGFLLVWRMLRPLNTIDRTAREIGESNLVRRIEVSENNDELDRLASTLNRTFERLRNALDRERRFTSDASHELRTPLSIMRGEASLALTSERRPEEYRKSLEVISGEINHMSSTIDKLLTLTRTDSGRERLNLEPVDMAGFLADLASDVEVLCEEKSLRFRLDIDGSVTVAADRVKLRELFLNLQDNAIRCTPAGGSITVSLAREGSSAVAAVKDNGVGIPPEHLPHIFERFYRVDRSSSSGTGGSGLGLAISQSIAELHGGVIAAESLPGKGSTFRVILPAVKNG